MGSSVEERELQLKKVYDKHFVLLRHELASCSGLLIGKRKLKHSELTIANCSEINK
jgi:hypothetical protein